MQEYLKIQSVFKRNTDGSKKLIIGDWISNELRYLQNLTWECTEKIDGTNIRVHWDGHKVEFGGRTDRANIPVDLVNKLYSMFGGSDTEQLFEQLFGERDVILFGEGYGPKIQNGGNYRSDVSFILFDVMISGNYQPRECIESVAQAFGIDVVPIVFEGTLVEAVQYVRSNPKSTFGTADMEGVVARPKVELQDRCGKRIICKIKCKDFEVET